MKRALLYRTIIAFLMLPIMVLASNDKDKGGKYTKEKTYHEEFSVNADAMLKIDNSYGNLDIVTWNENRIVIDITITTNGNNEEKVQKKLDGISVEFESNSNLVSAETIFNKKSSWWNWNSSSNVNMTINYVIKMPITNQVDLDNDYGNINLDKLEGRANISCDYGKVTTKELLADNNTINFDYTQKSYFEFIKSGKINADYSGFTVAKANALEIHSDYSNSVVEIVEDISYNCDYGTIKIEKVNNVSGNGDYLTTVLGDVYKTASLKADYGSIKIENLGKNVSDVNIRSSYVGIKIGYDPEYNFNFDIDLEYASLRDHEGFEFTKQHEESSDKIYLGYHGSNSTNNLVKINSDYGSVSFHKN